MRAFVRVLLVQGDKKIRQEVGIWAVLPPMKTINNILTRHLQKNDGARLGLLGIVS